MAKVLQLAPKTVQEKKFSENDVSTDKSTGVLLKVIADLITCMKRGEKLNSESGEVENSIRYYLGLVGEDSIAADNRQKIDEILSNLQCNMCKSTNFSTQLSCGHCYCDACVENIYGVMAPGPSLQCNICNEDIFPIELGYDFSNTWFSGLKKLEGACMDCGAPQKEFRGCKHFCDWCLCERYRNGDLFCGECNTKIRFPEELRSKEVVCSSCKEKVFVLGDYVKATDCQHMHCFNCLKEVLNTKQCQSCRSEITDEGIKSIANFLHRQCKKCLKFSERVYFVPKLCCNAPICGFCQAPSTVCKMCESPLDNNALVTVEKFAAAQRLEEMQRE